MGSIISNLSLLIGIVGAIIAFIVGVVRIGKSWGSLNGLVREIKKTLDEDVRPDLKDIKERFGTVEDMD